MPITSQSQVDLRHCYADGVLRTNAEWKIIWAAFARKHARQDAKPRKQGKRRPRQKSLDTDAQQHLDAIFGESP